MIILFFYKLFIKQITFPFLIIFLIIFSCYLQTQNEHSALYFVKYFYYAIIVVNFYFLILTVNIVSNKKNIFYSFYNKRKLRIYLHIIYTGFFVSLILFIIPALILAILNNSLIFISLSHFLIIWILSNLLSLIIGVFCSVFLSEKIALMVAISTYSLFIFFSFSTSSSSLSKMLNIYDDNIRVHTNEFYTISFDQYYWLDKLFILSLCLIIFSFSMLFIKRKEIKSISLIIMLITLLVPTMLYSIDESENSKQNQSLSDSNEKFSYNYKIIDYNMNLSLNKTFLENKASIKLKAQENDHTVMFFLNDIFSVNSINSKNKEIKFHTESGRVFVDLDMKKNNIYELDIYYSGNVDVKNNLNVPIFYINQNAINLPGFSFNWYPSNNQVEKIQYEILLHSNLKNVYSNLQRTKNIYQGQTQYASFFASPFYVSFEEDKRTYIIPDVKNKKQYVKFLKDKIKYLKIKESFKYDRVIVCPFNTLGFKEYIVQDNILYIEELDN